MRRTYFGLGSFAAGFVSVIACVGAASAQPLIDNLGETTKAVTILGTEDPDMIWAAQSFTTPTRVTLDSIETLLGTAVGEPDAVGELRTGDDPSGAVLATFAIQPLALLSQEIVLLSPDVTVLLEPGQTYWLVLGTATTGSFGWSYALGNVWLGAGSLGAYSYSSDFGVSWGAAGTDDPYQVRVNVTPIDCPADFNRDGFVDFFDFDDFVLAFEAGDPAADFNIDGFIDFFDFDDFVLAFETGC
jgi:hypothetical protein